MLLAVAVIVLALAAAVTVAAVAPCHDVFGDGVHVAAMSLCIGKQ